MKNPIDLLAEAISAVMTDKQARKTFGSTGELRRFMRTLPAELSFIARGEPRIQLENLIEWIDENQSEISKWGLAHEFNNALEYVLQQLVRNLAKLGVAGIDTFITLFEGLVKSEHYHQICLEWIRSAQRDESWEASLMYCEIVEMGLVFVMVWELGPLGEIYWDRAKEMYEELCNEDAWKRKRRKLKQWCRLAEFPNGYALRYSRVPSLASKFREVRKYIWRASVVPPTSFNEEKRQRTINMLNETVVSITQLRSKGKRKGSGSH